MTKVERLFPLFGIAFALIYAPVMNNNWSLATYQPKQGIGSLACIRGSMGARRCIGMGLS